MNQREKPKRPNDSKARSRRVIKSISVATVAERQEILAQRVEQDRKERFEKYVSKVMQLKKSSTMATRAAYDGATHLKILAEGDSWFEYPLEEGGIIDQLQEILGIDICNMAHHGDEVRQIMGVSQREELRKRLSNGQVHFDVLLFSGGGNDLVGDQFCIWLNDFEESFPAEKLINNERLSAVLSTVEAGYRDLISIRDGYSPQTKIFFHGYDFPRPTGKKACFVGPWLKPSLEERKIPGSMQFEVVKIMLTQFAEMLKKLCRENPGSVFYVPTQGTLQPTKEWWANEIHPSPKGFLKLAEVFSTALSSEETSVSRQQIRNKSKSLKTKTPAEK
ncbi:MAG: hypothetical protein HZC49_01205 [Nitrospirae bacterium]|nr:hypothetical protein [Nitrospirota bacterium]